MFRWPGSASLLLPLLLSSGPCWAAPAIPAVPERRPTPVAVAREPSTGHTAADSEPVPPVRSVTPVHAVDLGRYTGLWHEIARIPNRFQRQCARDSLAVYTLRGDGTLGVLNQCRKRDGAVEEARGVARVVDPVSRARLKVSLVSFLGWRPFWGDYWIIGLDPDYGWAVVGDPGRRFGWILARSTTLDPAAQSAIEVVLERNGYNRKSFQFAPAIQASGGAPAR